MEFERPASLHRRRSRPPAQRAGVAAWIGLAIVSVCTGLRPASTAASSSPSPRHLGGSEAPLSSAFVPDAAPRYHNGETLRCADCHWLHASASADSLRLPAGSAALELGSALLRSTDPIDVCLSCHDGSTGAPDVVGSDANGLRDRSAGFFAPPGAVNPCGHDLGRGVETGVEALCARCHGGAGTRPAVTCLDCHDPHGNGRARNLRWAGAPDREAALGLFVDPAATGLERYEASRVSYGTLGSDMLREISSTCDDCHHALAGARGRGAEDGPHVRHPSYDSEHGATNSIAQGNAAPAHWLAGTGSGFEIPRVRTVVVGATSYAAGKSVDPARNGVFCLTCHRAHGSGTAFGLAWEIGPRGAAAPGCDQCHALASVGAFSGAAP